MTDFPVTVFVSGAGSNMKAILRESEAGRCAVRVAHVISDRNDAAALDFARDRGIATSVVSPRDHTSRDEWNRALRVTAELCQPRLLVFAGFMRVVSTHLLDAFPRRVINVHPSLLPSFPGTHAPKQALDAGARIAGCTVHYVDAGVDTGPILAQGAVVVRPDDSEQELHARIQRVEHVLLPHVLDSLARGVALQGGSSHEILWSCATPNGPERDSTQVT